MSVDPRGCQLCSRLVDYRIEQQGRYPDYFNAPVPGFGADGARLLIVGLAPGLHGANASGRPFTGDSSGKLLFASLYRAGFASSAEACASDDEIRLSNCRITNAVKCLPPKNRPMTGEIDTCNRYLGAEIDAMPPASVLLALGGIAHQAIIKALDLPAGVYRFCHAAEFALPNGLRLVDCYHPSRYNQNTGRLTAAMMDGVLARIEDLLGG